MTYLCEPIPFYVYKIVCTSTGEYYFGSRYSHVNKGVQPVNDLWKLYFTSSFVIKDLVAIYGKEQFDATVVATFSDENETFWYEQSLIAEHIDDPLCLNLTFVSYKEGRKISIPVGLIVWTNNTTGHRRYSKTSPGDEWSLGGSANTNCTAYNKEGSIRYFESDPGDGWTKGFGNLHRINSVRYGNSYNKHKLWWNNRERSVLRRECPGPEWIPGRLSWTNQTTVSPDTRTKIGEANKGKRAYNNGVKTVMRKDHPGEGWNEGPLNNITTKMKQRLARKGKPSNTLGKHWWTNGVENKLTETCPGVEWSRGRLTNL